MNTLPITIAGIKALALRAEEDVRLPRSLHNYHFPGLRSIVLAEVAPGCLLRAYVAPPGGLHPWLTDEQSPALWHAHAHDFEAMTVLGRVNNYVARHSDQPTRRAEHSLGVQGLRPFFLWEHEVGNAGAERSILCTGRQQIMGLARFDSCGLGASYTLAADEVHRVVFAACPRTGWFIALIREIRRAERPMVAWSTERLSELPGAAGLCSPMTGNDVRAFCEWMEEGVLGAGGKSDD